MMSSKVKLFIIIVFPLGMLVSSMNACSKFDVMKMQTQESSSAGISDRLFESTKAILARDCMSCHRAGGSAISFEFDTAEQFISAGLIVPGQPRRSKLIYRLSNYNEAGAVANNMPTGRGPIPDSDYQAIYSWIGDMPSGQSPFRCDIDQFDNEKLRSNHAKRLSVRQYSNTLKDLLSLSIARNTAVSMVDSAMAATNFPADTGQSFRRENNTFVGDHATAHFEVADRIATTISGQHLNNFVTQFINLNPGTCSSINVSSLSAACRGQLIRNFAGRAFRRPIREPQHNLTTNTGEVIDELATYSAEFNSVTTQEAVNRLVFRVLMAPHFIFQIEDQDLLTSQQLAANTYVLSPHAFVSRLSYRLWNTMPDNELWRRAQSEDFSTETAYLNTLNYVLSQRAKVDDAMREYMHDWLKLSRTPRFNPNERFGLLAPGISFNDSLRSEMIQEVEEFGSFTLTSGGTFNDLFTSNISLARGSNLMSIYAQATPSPSFQNLTESNAVRFPASQERGGILTRAAMLVSGSEITSPILRAVHLRKDVLCLDLSGSAPANALDVFNGTEVPHVLSMRDKVDIKTSGASCVSCHNQINPLGFGLSNFNAFGMHMTQEPIVSLTQNAIQTYVPIDSQVDLSAILGPGARANGAIELSQLVSQQETTRACFSEKIMAFSLNRSVSRSDDACRLDKIYTNLNDESALLEMLRATAIDLEMRLRKTQ